LIEDDDDALPIHSDDENKDDDFEAAEAEDEDVDLEEEAAKIQVGFFLFFDEFPSSSISSPFYIYCSVFTSLVNEILNLVMIVPEFLTFEECFYPSAGSTDWDTPTPVLLEQKGAPLRF
jgi:hypothetical protein